ncbi:hypothetical protein [Burkholderia plantarii]|uniref:hypothetical protein n=1 Tax=Burkholderia plantarii TaxID=41899 RepID=UPI001F5B7183|nr:hypothetical protein [Burkholderia plantarii]
MQEISTESGEQASGIVQIGQAVAQMEQVTQQNAALVEEAAAAPASLERRRAAGGRGIVVPAGLIGRIDGCAGARARSGAAGLIRRTARRGCAARALARYSALSQRVST